MLQDLKKYVKAGFALHWLREREKRPVLEGWAAAPVLAWDDFARKHATGLNVGVRLGEFSKIGDLYLHVIDLDVRNKKLVDEALAALGRLIKDRSRLPTVISGSGGASRHFYFLTDKPFQSRKLAHSETSHVDKAGKKHWDWEIELFGTGKQVVSPPSIHPNGKPYVWEREFDFDDLEDGLGPYIPAATVESWGVRNRLARFEDDEDDLIGILREAPLEVSLEDIRGHLDMFDEAWWDDRDLWLMAGAALHHQFDGSVEGYQLWTEFSKRSKRFDEDNQVYTWKKLGRGEGENKITLRSVIKEANAARNKRDLDMLGAGMDDEEGADDDEEDLIGLEPTPQEAVLPAKERPKPVEGWRSLLDFSQEGGLKNHLHNLKMIVANDIRLCGIVGYNQFSEKIRLIREPKRVKKDERREKHPRQLVGWKWEVDDAVNGDPWTDNHDIAVRAIIEAPTTQGGYGIKVSDRDLHGALNEASTDQAFHPVRDYLTGLEHTGKGCPVDEVFIKFLGCPDNAYYRQIARNMFVGAVARIFEPGHKFDFAVIIEGVQGKRKSTFIECLAKGWFATLGSDFSDDKAMIESMSGAWIIEIPELSGFNKHDVQQIKAFISRCIDKARLAYARRVGEYPRQCIFIGTTNDKRYLRDETGGRRFWPAEATVGTIDTDALLREIDQIWAEAVAIYRAMRAKQPKGTLPLYLTGVAADIAAGLQETRRVETADDAMRGQIMEWLDTPLKGDGMDGEDAEPLLRDRVCCVQIGVECLGYDKRSYLNAPGLPQRIGNILATIPGWVQGDRVPVGDYGRQRSYFRI